MRRNPELEEDVEVNAWRITRFLELGYTVDQAIELAHLPVDHHDLERLILRGCSPDTAARILA